MMPHRSGQAESTTQARGIYIEPSYPWERMYGIYDSRGKRRGELRIPIEDDTPYVLEQLYLYLDTIDRPLQVVK